MWKNKRKIFKGECLAQEESVIEESRVHEAGLEYWSNCVKNCVEQGDEDEPHWNPSLSSVPSVKVFSLSFQEAETTCITEGEGWCFMSLAFQEFPLSFLLFTRAEVQMQILGFSFRCGCGLEPQGLLCWPTVQLRRTGDPTGEKTKAQGGSSGVRILWNAEEEENARIWVFIRKWDLLPRNALLKVLY